MKSFLTTFVTAAGLCSLLAWPVPAEGLTYQLTVEAGKHDRTNTPVSVLLTEAQQQANLDPVLLGDARSVTLTDASGKELPAQLTMPGLLDPLAGRHGVVARRVHFVLPKLNKGESLKLRATVSPMPPPSGGFAWKDVPKEYSQLSLGDRPVLRYMCKPYDDSDCATILETYKVYHHVYDPAGDRIITKGPGGLFTHHRGVFFGFSRCSYEGGKVDTWHCNPRGTHQAHAGLLAKETGSVLGRHTVAVDWHAPDKCFAKEKRELTVYHMPGGRLIEFASRLCSTGGEVRLDGDPQHAGFQFRAAQEVAAGDQKLTYYLRTDGKGAAGETRNWPEDNRMVDLPWNAMSFVIDGRRYTAVYLDKPTNPKPSRYSERTYGRFGSYFVHEFSDDKCLEVNYRIWLQQGEITAEQASALSDDFVEPVSVTLR